MFIAYSTLSNELFFDGVNILNMIFLNMKFEAQNHVFVLNMIELNFVIIF